MIINIPTVVEELKENATEEQRKGLNILERRFYECIDLNKKLDIATKALEAYARGGSDAGNGCLYETPAPSLAQQALNKMEEV